MENTSVIITGVHFELTEAIKSVVHEKMNKLFRHEPDIIRVRVELTKDVDKKTKMLSKSRASSNSADPTSSFRHFRTICTMPSTIWRKNSCENCETARA